MGYASLAQRLVDYYRSTTPAFAPIKSDQADKSQQEQMHRFLLLVCDRLSDDPSIVGLTDMPDGHFTWQQMYKRDPQLKKDVTAAARKLHRLYEFILSLGIQGRAVNGRLVAPTKEAKLTPSKATLLERLGLIVDRRKAETTLGHPQLPSLAAGWLLLAQIASHRGRDGAFFFSRSIYAPSPETALRAFIDKVADAKLIAGYIAFLEQRGFKPAFDLSADGMDMTVRYTKCIEGAHRPLGGLCLEANPLRGNQPACSIDLVESLKFMHAYPEMSDQLQHFVFHASRKCNGCGYCIQTSKTKKIKAVDIAYNGQTARKCPFYLRTRWEHLDAQLISAMKEAIEFNEAIVAG